MTIGWFGGNSSFVFQAGMFYSICPDLSWRWGGICHSSSGLLLPVTETETFNDGPQFFLSCCSLSCQLEEKSMSLKERLDHSASCDLILLQAACLGL